MAQTIRTERKELTAEAIVRELDRGNRVLIEVDILGTSMTMALRRRDETYYCDTPLKLLTYETRDAMRRCLERYRLAKAADAEERDADPTLSATE